MKPNANEDMTMATTAPKAPAAAPSSASLTDALWQRYRGTGDPEARTQLLDELSNAPLAGLPKGRK